VSRYNVYDIFFYFEGRDSSSPENVACYAIAAKVCLAPPGESMPRPYLRPISHMACFGFSACHITTLSASRTIFVKTSIDSQRRWWYNRII